MHESETAVSRSRLSERKGEGGCRATGGGKHLSPVIGP